MHCITLLHLGDTKIDHAPQLHPSIYANEYTDHIQETSLVVAFQYYCLLWRNGKHFLRCIFAWLLYNYWHCAHSTLEEYFLVSPLIDFVISTSMIFSSLVIRPAYGYSTNDLKTHKSKCRVKKESVEEVIREVRINIFYFKKYIRIK